MLLVLLNRSTFLEQIIINFKVIVYLYRLSHESALLKYR